MLIVFAGCGFCLNAQLVNDSCHKAYYFCGEYFCYPSSVSDQSLQPPGANYGCLNYIVPSHQGKWFLTKALSGGPISLYISTPTLPNPCVLPTIIWGGFDDTANICVTGLTGDKIVFCEEYLLTPGVAYFNATAGQYYFMHIITPTTGTPAMPYPVCIEQNNFSQPGHGTLDCTPLNSQPCIFTFIYPDTTPCNTAANTFSITGQIGYMYPPADGYLIVKDLTSGLADTLTPPFQALSAFAIEGVPCDGQVHMIEAWFTDGECTISGSITAPSGDCAVGVMSGGGHICQPSGPPAEVYITAYGGLPPYSFSWSVNGVPQPGVSGYNGPWPYVISAPDAGTYTLLSMAGSDCPGTASGSAVVTASQPIVSLNDTTVCAGETVWLDAGPGFTSYLWNTGFTGQILSATQPGTYSVTVTDSFGCQASDSATITHHPLPQPLLIKHN
jgi:hypothetical protein